ncbi:MAG TPA: efflux RND transporter permease subunit [Gemmatales bacterium]|nr:efflux RND transporter permease subunit [Gemmatales bacterium]
MLNISSKARPYFGAVVLTVALLSAGGIYCVTRMPSGVYPEVTFPRIAIVAKMPGLAVPNMEVQVTQPLEQAVSTVMGVSQVRSKTIRGGSELYLDFSPGTDMALAQQLTWNRISAVRAQLPAEVELTVEQMTPSIFPIISLVLKGGDSPTQLRDFAFYQFAPLIKNIPDVLYANVAGGDIREIIVEARPNDLLAAGLSAADLADQISKSHRLTPVGRIEMSPFAFQVMVNAQVETAREIEQIIVASRNNQPLRVRDVADVKVKHQDRTLSIGFEGRDAVVITIFRRLGGNTFNISHDLQQLLISHPLPRNIQAKISYDQAQFVGTAVNNVRDAIVIGSFFSVIILLLFLRSLRATFIAALAIPTTLAITFLIMYWSGATLNLMSLGGLAVAIGLIIDDSVVVIENIARHLTPKKSSTTTSKRASSLTLWLQPWNWRRRQSGAAAVTILETPSTTFQEKDPVDAASSEITGAVFGSTLTTVLVFVPLAFISGVQGQFFASLSWSLSIAVLVSMVISLTLIPVLAARFLASKPMPQPGLIYRAAEWLYEQLLIVALKVPWLTLTLSLLAVVAGVILYTGIPDTTTKQEPGKPPPPPLFKGLQTGLMPAMDEGSFIFDYWAPAGTPLQRTETMTKKIEQIMSENPDIDSYVRRTGSENGLFATQTNRGDIQVMLRDAEDDPLSLLRKPVRPEFEKVEPEMKALGKEMAEKKYGVASTEEQIAVEGKLAIRKKYRRRPLTKVMEEIEDQVKDHFAEHQLKIELVQVMQDELNDLSGANKPIEIKVFGPDYRKLLKIADEIGEKLEKLGKGRGVKEVNAHVSDGNPDLMIRIDYAKANRLGLSVEAIERQLRVMFLGQVATQVRESAVRLTSVRVRYADPQRFGIERFDPQLVLDQWIILPENSTPPGLNAVPTVALSGPSRAIPLSSIATIERIRTPEEQWRENQRPVAIISAELNEEEAGLGEVVAMVKKVLAEFPFPADYTWEIGGHYLQQQAVFKSLLIVMIVATLLVFIMLAFQFRSVVLPLLIFLTQPLSLVSGLFALWLTNTPLNVSSYMGAILLVGLDMKNGILLVEYIQQLRLDGMALRPALLLAGRTRFRPILMTSLAAILGLFPLALGIGPGAQMQQPLAIMVIGGLTANMLFTRIIIPVGYLVLERWVSTSPNPTDSVDLPKVAN